MCLFVEIDWVVVEMWNVKDGNQKIRKISTKLNLKFGCEFRGEGYCDIKSKHVVEKSVKRRYF